MSATNWVLLPKGAKVRVLREGVSAYPATLAEDCTHDHVLVAVSLARGVERMVHPADLRVVERPELDEQGHGEWLVYFESSAPKTFHRWRCTTKKEAVEVAQGQQSWRGGVVTVSRRGVEVFEVAP